jgi:cation diffusion facilitator family transporter
MKLSLIAGFVMLVLKTGAYLLTGSAAILGDAAESVVHVAAVIFATFSLYLASKPADENHRYGHTKIAFFSAGVEGGLILIAAVFIVHESVRRWIAGSPPANMDQGALLTAATIIINWLLGAYLIRTGRKNKSLILVANGKHVLTDSHTSIGALVGLALVHFTKWPAWDPICGLLMGGNIVISGYGLIQQSVAGLMDVADPELTRRLDEALTRETARHGVSFHELRHRDSGGSHWIEVHLLFRDDISLSEAHRIATDIETALQNSFERPLRITSHLECEGDHKVLHPHESPPALKWT